MVATNGDAAGTTPQAVDGVRPRFDNAVSVE